MYIGTLLDVLYGIINGSVDAMSWLFVPLDGINIAPVYIFTFAGLIAYLTIAIIKWLVA